jgi:hypothetical protein
MTQRVYRFVGKKYYGIFCPVGATLIQPMLVLLMKGNLYEAKGHMLNFYKAVDPMGQVPKISIKCLPY